MPMLQTEVYSSSRSKIALMLLGALAFVAIAVFLPADEQSQNWRIYCGGFFGFCAIVFLCLLVRPQRLTLDAEGFMLSGGLMLPSRVKKIRWDDIEGFSVFETGRGNKLIAYNFSPGASERTRLSRFNHAAFGLDAALPSGWPGGAAQMAEHLNTYRAQALQIANEYGA
jgi:hypothetical protein